MPRAQDLNVCAGRMSMSPPTTARGSLVPVFEGAIPEGVAPEPPQHTQVPPVAQQQTQPAETAGSMGAGGVPGGVGGSGHGMNRQPTVSSAVPAGELTLRPRSMCPQIAAP